MDKNQPIDTAQLVHLAANSGNAESCKLFQKSCRYRIAAGARLDAAQTSTFFLEVTLHMNSETMLLTRNRWKPL